MSVCRAFRPQFQRTWQLPSNAHAYRLYVFNEPQDTQQLKSSHFASCFLPLHRDQRSLVFYNAFCVFSKKLFNLLEKTPSRETGRFRHREPDDDLLSHGNPHYHWRRVVSLSCSGWEGVGPTRYGRQAKLFVTLTQGQDNQFIELISFIDLTNL